MRLTIRTILLLILGVSHVSAGGPKQFFDGEALELGRAIKAGDVARIASLVDKVDVNKIHVKDMTFLMYAFATKKPGAIKSLVIAGANPLQEDPDLGSPLALSVKHRNIAFLAAMLDAGVSPNSRVKWGKPILFLAAERDDNKALELLVEHGVDLALRSENVKRGVLEHAFAGLNYDQVVYLIEKGANAFERPDRNGVTFAYYVQSEFEHQAQNKRTPAFKKLNEIRNELIKRGVTFPTATPKTLKARQP